MPIAAWGTAPALAAGNAVLLKPAETTPLTALRLAELALEAGLPEGLFQVLPGDGAGRRHRAGRAPRRRQGRLHRLDRRRQADHGASARRSVKRVTLELGGKSPNIVFADADLEAAAAAAPGSFLDNTGQDCCARSRILVQRSVYDRFLELLEPAVEAVHRRRPGRRRHPDGPADLRRPARAGTVLRPRGRPGRHPRRGPRRPGLLVPGHRPGRRRARRPRGRRGDLRPGRRRPALRGRGRRGPARQRHRLRPVRLASGPATSAAPCASRAPSRAGNLSVNSHSSVRYCDPLRRLQAVRPRPRTGPRRPDRLHRDQERLHQHRGAPHSDGPTDDRATCAAAWSAVPPSSPEPAAASAWPPPAGCASEGAHVVCADIDETRGQGRGRRGRRALRPGRRHRLRAGRGALQDRVRHLRLGRHRLQQRRASRRPTTTRSSPPAWTPGSASRRSTSPPSTCAARPPCPTCGARAAAPSSTPRPSWP